MAKNTTPIFTNAQSYAGVEITAANTRSDGNGTIATDIFLVATVSATEGAYLRHIELWPTATVAATATTATVARAFLSTQSSGATTASNTHPIGERALASQSASNSTTAVAPIIIPINRTVPTNTSILVTNHAAPAANTKWKAVAYWGEYNA
jgi:hypothetical protein